MKIIDKVLTIDEINNIDVKEPVGLIYNDNFGIHASEFISYATSIGGYFSLSVDPSCSIENKAIIIKDFIWNGEYIFSAQLMNCVIALYLSQKSTVPHNILDNNLLTLDELKKVASILKDDLNELTLQIESIFFLMLFSSYLKTFDILEIKHSYPSDFIKHTDCCGCLIPLIQQNKFLDIYKYKINRHPYFYDNLFIDYKDNFVNFLSSIDNYIMVGMNILQDEKQMDMAKELLGADEASRIV